MAPMSFTASSWRLIRLSAISVISRGDRLPETTSAMIGEASGSNFSMIGASVPSGNSETTPETFSRMSLAASVISRSRTKVAKI